MSKTLQLHPRVSEKAYASSQTGVYVFVVPASSNKISVASAVQVQFDVKVLSVNISNLKGKPVRFYRKGKFDDGSRSDIKKAYVRIAEGQSIPVFAAAEEAQSEPAKKTKKSGKE
jgi:large subunit ribosomal protein L23